MVDAFITKIIFVTAIFIIVASASVDAAQLFAMYPGEEVCTSIVFGDDGRGDYVLTVTDPGDDNKPWSDNHFTRYIASDQNRISIPICFNTIGRSVGDEAVIVAKLETPNGEKTFEYGICTANYEDEDKVISISPGKVCQQIGMNTDILSASFKEPKKYAQPGEDITFDLVIDMDFDAKVSIAKSSGDMKITASTSSVTTGEVAKEVEIRMTAPSEDGTYTFSILASVDGCDSADCSRDVTGVLEVGDPRSEPQTGLMVWLTPETKTVDRDTTVQLSFLTRNYGKGQEVTLSVSTENGVLTNFEDYSKFITKGDSENTPVSVRVTADDGERFEVTAVATGADGTSSSSKAWLVVDEVQNDIDLLGDDDLADKAEDGDVTLKEIEKFKNDKEDDDIPEPPEPDAPVNYILYIAIIIIIAVVGLALFMIYKKNQGGGSQEEVTWESLGSG